MLEILSSAGLDLLFFCLLALGYIGYRKLRSPSLNLRLAIEMKKPYMHEGEYSVTEIWKKVKNTKLDEVYSGLGEWGYLYLIFHKYIVYCMSVLCLLGCGILLVIYSSGSSDVKDSFHFISISHILKNHHFLIVPISFIFGFGVFLYSLCYYVFKHFMSFNTEEIIHPTQDYVVYVKGLQTNFSVEQMDAFVEKVFKSQFGPGLEHVYTIPNYIEGYKHYKELIEYQNKLKYYKILHANENSGLAFVILDSKSQASSIIELGLEKSDIIDTSEWKTKQAACPGELNWENIGSHKSISFIVKLLTNLLFVLTFLIVMTPANFDVVINWILEYIGFGKLIRGVIGIYFPSLLLLLYQQLILPTAIEFLVNSERHARKNRAVFSGLKKYLFYLVFYIFLYPLFGLQFIDFLWFFAQNGTNWQDTFALKVNQTGQFFTIFLIHEAFMKNGWDLMVTGKFFASGAKALFASTKAEKILAYQSDLFMFDLEIAITLNVLIVTCGLCIVYPLILVPSFCFFFLRVFFI